MVTSFRFKEDWVCIFLTLTDFLGGVGLVGWRDKVLRVGGIGVGLRREKDGEGRILLEEEGMGEDVDRLGGVVVGVVGGLIGELVEGAVDGLVGGSVGGLVGGLIGGLGGLNGGLVGGLIGGLVFIEFWLVEFWGLGGLGIIASWETGCSRIKFCLFKMLGLEDFLEDWAKDDDKLRVVVRRVVLRRLLLVRRLADKILRKKSVRSDGWSRLFVDVAISLSEFGSVGLLDVFLGILLFIFGLGLVGLGLGVGGLVRWYYEYG